MNPHVNIYINTGKVMTLNADVERLRLRLDNKSPNVWLIPRELACYPNASFNKSFFSEQVDVVSFKNGAGIITVVGNDGDSIHSGPTELTIHTECSVVEYTKNLWGVVVPHFRKTTIGELFGTTDTLDKINASYIITGPARYGYDVNHDVCEPESYMELFKPIGLIHQIFSHPLWADFIEGMLSIPNKNNPNVGMVTISQSPKHIPLDDDTPYVHVNNDGARTITYLDPQGELVVRSRSDFKAGYCLDTSELPAGTKWYVATTAPVWGINHNLYLIEPQPIPVVLKEILGINDLNVISVDEEFIETLRGRDLSCVISDLSDYIAERIVVGSPNFIYYKNDQAGIYIQCEMLQQAHYQLKRQHTLAHLFDLQDQESLLGSAYPYFQLF